MPDMQMQDDAKLRSLLGLGHGQAIPQPVLDTYFQFRRYKHRIIAGPLGVDTLMLVCYASKGWSMVPDDNGQPVAAEKAKEPKPPGRALPDTGNINYVGGRAYFVKWRGQWHLLPYKQPGSEASQHEFGAPDDDKNTIVVDVSSIRLTE